MEEQAIVNNPIQQPPVKPMPPKQNHWIIAIITLVFLIVLGSVYILGQRLQKQMVPPLLEPSLPPKITLQPSPSDETANWKTYTNSIYNYSLKYPPDWKTMNHCQGKSSQEEPDEASICFLSKDFVEEEAGDIWQRGFSKGGLITIYEGGFRGHGLPSDKNVCTPSQLEGKQLECGPITINNILAWRSRTDGFTEIGIVKDNKFFLGVIAFGSGTVLVDQILSTFKFTNPEDQVVCTADVKECADGSYVSRQPPDCEFAVCPQK